MDAVRRLMQNAELDGSRPMHLREFLYMLVQIGVGTSDRPRCILLPGASYQDAFRMGFPLKELWELGYDDLVQVRKAGWSAHDVQKAGLAEAWQMRQVGYSAGELRKIGCEAKQLKLAGYSMEELRNAGFSSEVLRECCSVLSKHRATRKDEESGLTLVNPSGQPGVLGAIFEKGGPNGELRWWGTPRIKAMLDGPGGNKIDSVKARPVTAPILGLGLSTHR
jgi:hypothetical protein